jgi:hypothetical protein
MSDPLKIHIMNVDEFVEKKDLLEVTSSFIKNPSTGTFDENGLFSESIFGEMASSERISNRGYISLNTKILHPRIYNTLLKIKSVYKDIMFGNEYAVFNEKTKDFELVDMEHEEADTGFSFFVEHVAKLEPKLTGAVRKDTSIKLLLQNKDKMFIDKQIVIPAGLRDIKTIGGRDEIGDINKVYMSILSLARTLKVTYGDSKIFDPVMVALQSKCNELFDFILNILDGKTGFLQEKYGSRGIALGTRNVISAADTTAVSATSGALLKSSEVLIPLFQVIHMFRPLVVYNLKTMFFNNIFSRDSLQASLIDPKTYNLNYHTIPLSEKNKFTQSDKVIDGMHSFQDNTIKHDYVSCYADDGKQYYLYLTYREGDRVFLFRGIGDLELLVSSNQIKEIDKTKIRPLTYFEMYYMAAIYLGEKHATITRFPVAGPDSIFPARVHIATTARFEEVMVTFAANPMVQKELSRFPIYRSEDIGSVALHPSQLKPLTADHDGDTISCLGVISEEANQEVKKYIESAESILNTTGVPIIKMDTDMAVLTMYNLTRDLDK